MESDPLQNYEAEIANVGTQVAELMISQRERRGNYAGKGLTDEDADRVIEHGWDDLSHKYPKYQNQITQFKHIVVPYLRYGPTVAVDDFLQFENIKDSMSRYVLERALETRISGRKKLDLPSSRQIPDVNLASKAAEKLAHDFEEAGINLSLREDLSFAALINVVLKGDLDMLQSNTNQ